MAMHAQTDFSLVPMLLSFPATTTRLKLVPNDKDLADAEKQGHANLAAKLSAKVPDSWPPEFVPALEKRKVLPWRTFYMILTTGGEAQLLVGVAALALWPSEAKTLQFGAALVPEHQGRHFGGEFAAMVAEWAIGVPELDRVVSEAPGDNVGFVRGIERAGYTMQSEAPGPGFVTFARYVGAS